ncbi:MULTISPECIES: TauD/TfdA family dioxygenase [unclassified Streptomyces]|uniref:TauD/TfdA family dioxygenase n=1 Tax=unclassified Streptomyces TaxID=2593676 RepID=UPI0036C4DEA6
MELAALDRVELRVSAADSRTIWELSQRAAALAGAPTTGLAELLLDVPPAVRGPLLTFASGASRSGYLLIRGLQVGEVPATPVQHGSRALAGHGTSGTLTLVADLLGSLIGYEDEKNGALIHEVHPVQGEEARIENSGAVDFDFHTENVHHPLRPDFLGLLCLRQDHEGVAATRVASVREAEPLLTDREREVLQSVRFQSAYPTSFSRHIDGPRPTTGLHPVLFGRSPQSFMRFNAHNTVATDAEGEAALRALSRALESVRHDVILAPGDLVLVDNHIAAHGRSSFTPCYDGKDRWLRRCYSLRAVPRWAEQMMGERRVVPALTRITGLF